MGSRTICEVVIFYNYSKDKFNNGNITQPLLSTVWEFGQAPDVIWHVFVQSIILSSEFFLTLHKIFEEKTIEDK